MMMATVGSNHSGLFAAIAAMNMATSSTVLPAASDSGYASQSSTPDISNSIYVNRPLSGGKNLWPRSFRKPKQLRPYNKTIPKLTWNRFSDLREQYAEKLNCFTRSLPNCPSVLMSLQVLGEDEETAEPWVFVQCDKAVFKKVSNFFKDPLIKIDFEPPQSDDRSPCLRVLVCPLKPRQLAKETDLSSQHGFVAGDDSIEIFGYGTDSSYNALHGIPIMSGVSHGMGKATMGGIILVIKEREPILFGMTAGHFLQGSYDESEDEPDDNSDDGFYVEESFELDLSFIEAEVDKEVETLPFAEAEKKLDKKADLNRWSKVGKLSEASHISLEDGRNLDWALIKIDRNSLSLSNMSCVYPYHFRGHRFSGSETDVVMVSTRGREPGILSSFWSYIMLPTGNVLIRANLLSFPDRKTLRSGDSGAWVADPVTHEVYGHVVASDVFGRGYVVPICDTFEDIQNRLSAYIVTLPSITDLLTSNICNLRLNPPFPTATPENPLVDHQISSMRNLPRPFYEPSDVLVQSSFPPNNTPLSSTSELYNHVSQPRHEFELNQRTYQVTGSGYSPINAMPDHSLPVNLNLGKPSVPRVPKVPRVRKAINRHSRPATINSPSSVYKPIDPEPELTGKLTGQEFENSHNATEGC